MRKFLRWYVATFALMCTQLGFGQTYVITPSAADVGNPGGVRTSSDFTTTGGTSIWTGAQAAQSWSATQALPFAFDFNGSPVTHYIVASNGLFSFDTTNAGSAVNTSLNTNGALPDANLPDNTIAYFWEDFTGVTSSTDDVYAVVEGSAPNRQLWILNYSMKVGSLSYGYWALVLEETTNKIYVVDMNYWFGGTHSATVGVQINSTTAFQTTGSPTESFNTGGSGNADNEYYEFTFYAAGAVIPPTSITSTNAAPTTVDINYDLGAATTGEIEYGPAGFTQGSGTTVTMTSTTSTTLTGLTPNTQYDYYLRSNSGGTYSSWVGAYSFWTTCVTVATYPYLESFDTLSVWSPSFNFDQCWTMDNVGSTSSFNWRVEDGPVPSSFQTGPLTDASGSGRYMHVEASYSSPSSTNMEMPALDLTSLTAPELNFKYHMYGTNMGNLFVQVSTDTGATWTSVDSIMGAQQPNQTDPWLLRIVDLSAYNTAHTLVRFQATRGGTYGDVSIDEVSIAEAPPCPTPTQYSASNIGSSTADITFSAQSGATRWVEWGPTGYTQGTGLTASSTGDTINLSGLPAGTCIDVYIWVDCSANSNGISAISGPYTFCTAYIPDWLEDFDGGYPPGDFFEAVGQIGSTVTYGSSNWGQGNYGNVSGGSLCAKFNIYSTFQPHHWMITPSIDFGTGNTYNLEYDVAWTEWNSTLDAIVGSDDTVHVVISEDNGVTWERSNIVMSYHQGNIRNAAGGHDIIALSGYSGLIRIGFYTTSTVSNEDTDFFIENLEVRTPPACQEPFGFNPINIYPDSIYFSFSADSSAASYNMEWGPCGFVQGTNPQTVLTNDTAGFGGLTAATCYDVYIQTDCGSGQSIWAGPFTFTTACDTLPIPWSEGFESVSVPDYPACWNWASSSTFYIGTATGTSGSNPGANSGTNYLRHRYSFNNTWWAFTPEFHLQAGVSYEFSFYYQVEGGASFDELSVHYGTGQTAADMMYVVKTENGVNSSSYTQFVATFIPQATGDYYIGIASRSSGFTGAIDMDDFQLQYDPNPCPNVSSLGATIVSENEVDMTWGATSAHTSFDVEWGPQGFTAGTGLGNLQTGLTSAMLNVDTLRENFCYDFYVRSNCGATQNAWVGPYSFCTPCSPATMPYLEDFNVWTPNCVNPSLGDQSWTGSNGWAVAPFWNYNDVSMIMSMRNVDIDTNARLKFTWSSFSYTFNPDDEMTLRARPLGTTAWDTLWNEKGEDLNSQDGANATNPGSGVNVILALPVSYVGNVVEFQWFGHSDFGPYVFIDNFLVEKMPTCPEPFTLDYMMASATSNSGTVYFTPGGASNFNIAYGPAATTTSPSGATIMNATNDTVTLTGLTDNTVYNVWVRDSCGAGDVSFWTGPVQFQTLCLPTTMPYLETFTAWPPNCMDVDNGDQPWISNGGWAEAAFWSWNDVDFEMTTPLVILNDSAQLTFDWSHSNLYATSYPYDSMQVRVRSASGPWMTVWSRAGAAFNSADGAGATTPGTGMSEYIDLLSYGPGDTIQVGFFAHSDFGPDVFVDNVGIQKKPDCASPSALGAFNATSSGFDVFWTAGSASATTWYVEYGPSGLTPGNGTSVMVTNDTATLSGLNAASQYCYYVTEICPNGLDSSGTIGPFCFATLCPPSFAAPYMTDLEVLPAGVTTSGDWDNCWTIYNGTGVPRWESEDASGANENSLATGPFYDHTLNGVSGGKYVYLETSGGSLGDTASMRSPWIDVSALNIPEFAFWYHMYGATMGNLFVEAREWGTSAWTTIDSIIGQQQFAGNEPWMERGVILTQFTSDTLQFRFVGMRGSSFTSDMSLDDIEVREAPTCPKINSVTFSNASTTGADANWTATVTGQTYEIEYGAGGFAQGSGTVVPATGTSYTFSGMTPNLAQEMYIRPICGVGDTGEWTGPFTIEIIPIPCDDFEAYATGDPDPQSVLINGWNGDGGDAEIVSFGGSQALHVYDSGPNGFTDVVANWPADTAGAFILGFDFQLATGAGGYYNILHNYTGPANVWAIEVYMDANGTATVDQGTNGTGTIGTYQFNTTGWNRIEHYIDLDADTAYIIVNGTATTVGWQFSLGASFNFGGQFNAVNFYSAANTGQTPNYYIDNFCVCPAPAGLMSTNATCTTVELDWTSTSGSSIIQYGPAGFTPGSGTFVTGTAPFTISGLTAGTAYDFWVGDDCNGDTLYAGPVSVTTPNGPLPSLNISDMQDTATMTNADYILYSGATNADSVHWDFGGGVTASGDTVSSSWGTNGTYTVTVTAFNDCGDTTVTYDLVVEDISVEETPLGRSLNIFPNPTAGVVTVTFDLPSRAETQLTIINGLGQMIETMELGDITSYNGQVDLSNLPKGVYILQINSGDMIVNRRITLQ